MRKAGALVASPTPGNQFQGFYINLHVQATGRGENPGRDAPGLCAERNHAESRRSFHTLCPADKLSCASQCGQRRRPVAPPHGMPPARTLLWGPAPDPRATCPAPGRRRGQASASAQTRPPRPSRSSITDPAARQAAAAAAPTPSRSPVHARRGHTGPQPPPRLVPPHAR